MLVSFEWDRPRTGGTFAAKGNFPKTVVPYRAGPGGTCGGFSRPSLTPGQSRLRRLQEAADACGGSSTYSYWMRFWYFWARNIDGYTA